MTESSGFYDPGNYDSATIAKSFARNLTNGIIAGTLGLNGLAVTEHAGAPAMSVDVATGGAKIVGYDYYNSAVVTKTIEAADVTHPRIDRIIVRNTSTGSPGSAVLAVLKGTAATPAVAPALTANATVNEISLASVSVVVGTTAITNAMITDERYSDATCGVARPYAVGKTAYMNPDMNGYKLTGLGAPSAATDSARYGDVYNKADTSTALDFTTTVHGLVPIGTNTGKFLRDDGTWAVTTVFRTAAASDTLVKSNDIETNLWSITYVLLAGIYIPANYNIGSVFRVKFDAKGNVGSGSQAIGQLYLNGMAVGSAQSDVTGSFVTKSQDLALGPGVLQLYGRASVYGTVYFQNFRVYCTDTNTVPGW
jgi:hypothetical protein